MSLLSLLPGRLRRVAAGALTAAALAGVAAVPAHAAQKVTPDVSGRQNVLVVGCRFDDTTSSDILGYADNGIRSILSHTHEYFDDVSNGRVDFEGDFAGWHDLPKSSGDYGDNGVDATKDCQDVATQVLSDRGEKATDYHAVVMLFNRDKGISNQTFTGDGRPGTWVRLRFSGGTGGGWTSEGVWAHELSHSFGLVHSTFPTRVAGNQYNDFQDVMSGYSQADQRRWNFPAGGVCNGIAAHPECIYSGHTEQMPVHMSAFQKQRLGWLSDDQVATHIGGAKTYPLSAPTYNPNHESTVELLKLVEVELPGTNAYYAVEYRRGKNDGDASDQAAFRRGWSSYEKGIRSDRVTVYLVSPDLYTADDDLGDANLVAVLKPGERYSAPAGAPDLSVAFDSVDQNSHLNASVTVTTPHPQPPTTILSTAGRDGTWANQDVTARLFTLPNPVGAPVATSYYGVDDRGCSETTRDCAIYDGNPFTIAGEGEHDVTYFSSDTTGGVETANHTTVRIDKTAPVTTPSVATAGGGVQLTLAAKDPLSGVQETDYDLDGAGFTRYTGPVTITRPGAHTVRVRSVDNATNAETPQTLSLTVPASPIALSAIATHRRILNATGRAVSIHVALRTDASNPTVRLTKVTTSAGGRVEGWTTGTADVDGKVYAIRGATYAFTYTVTDADGRTARATARVVVAG
jgi:M6 family metalloprotease-like protein